MKTERQQTLPLLRERFLRKTAFSGSSLDNLILLLGLLLGHLHLGDVLCRAVKGERERAALHGHRLKKNSLTRTESTVQEVGVEATGDTRTSHTVMLESAEPVTILSSLAPACRAHTLSWWASSVFTHSLVLMVHSFTKPSEPLEGESAVARGVC